MGQGIQLYERIVADGRSGCPYVWRIKLALSRKQLAYEEKPVSFTDDFLGGRHRSVPVMVDGEQELGDSWLMADYLDKAYPDTPRLFHSPAERAMAGFFDRWLMQVMVSELLPVYALDAHDAVAPKDQDYYRRTREEVWGQTLEEFVADREERLQDARRSFEPIRQTTANQPFIGGQEPNYADMCILGIFIWAGIVGTQPLLAASDPLVDYADRGFAFFSIDKEQLGLNLSEQGA